MKSFFKNKSKKKSLYIESAVAFLICLSPFLLYLHTFIPENITSFHTFFGVIKDSQFGSVQVFIFMIFNKFVPLFLLILLYITNKNWWSNIILIPIATYLFQLVSILLSSESFIDEVEFIYVIPIMVIILVPLYYIRKNLGIYLNAIDLKKEMEKVIEKKK